MKLSRIQPFRLSIYIPKVVSGFKKKSRLQFTSCPFTVHGNGHQYLHEVHIFSPENEKRVIYGPDGWWVSIKLLLKLNSRTHGATCWWGTFLIHSYKRSLFHSDITSIESTSVIFTATISKWTQLQCSCWSLQSFWLAPMAPLQQEFIDVQSKITNRWYCNKNLQNCSCNEKRMLINSSSKSLFVMSQRFWIITNRRFCSNKLFQEILFIQIRYKLYGSCIVRDITGYGGGALFYWCEKLKRFI